MSKIEVNAIEPQCGTTLTLGASGDTVQLGTGASQSGFGRTGTVNWDTTKKTASFTAVSGNGYFVDTSSSAITMTLPASPSAGDIVSVKDYSYTFATNNLTVARNGSNIGGGGDFDQTYNTDGAFLTFIYVDATQGWLLTDESNNTSSSTNTYVTATGGTVTTCGDFKIHTFTGPGTFCVSAGAGPVAVVEYLVVAGGAGAGFDIGGGGGAGGLRFAAPSLAPLTYPAKPLAGPSALPVSVQGYPVTVGAGGTSRGSQGPTGPTNSGSNSVFSTITSNGGGGGGSGPGGPPNNVGGPGGSGGGAGNGPGAASGGSGNTPPVSPAQGKDGGSQPGGATSGGGGGGFVCAGGIASQPDCAGGAGGDGGGFPTGFGSNGELCGSFRYYAGGGGGGGRSPAQAPGGPGGKGGGGDGVQTGPGNAGTANTGGGAGGPSGTSVAQAGAGGSGIVIIRYRFQ